MKKHIITLPQDAAAPLSDFGKQIIKDYRLTTAEILYHIPDFPELLQSYVWQDFDIAPIFPVLNNFLDFWTRELDGKLHSVYIASRQLITPADHRYYCAEITLQ
jgi:uncharacterized protein Usg